jgi:hypothetical protein
MQQVDLWITNCSQTMLNPMLAACASSRRRPDKHKVDNVLGFVPHKQPDQVEPELTAIIC